jgi:hypothetical protein
LESTIGTQERCGFDAIKTQDDRVDQCQYHLWHRVATVASRVGQLLGKKMPELQHSQKFMEEVDAAEMRQTSMVPGDC